MSSRAAPSPPRAALHPVHARAHVAGRIGWRRGQADAAQHGQVEHVVAHVGDLVVLEQQLVDDLVVGFELARARPGARA